MSAGNLKVEIQDQSLVSTCNGIVKEANTFGSVSDAMYNYNETRKHSYPLNKSNPNKHLVIIYTDVEPDDVLACAQLMAWKVELQELGQAPIFICCTDFIKKDGGTIFEKKQLMAFLALGEDNWNILTYEGDTGESQSNEGGTLHPNAKALANSRQAELDAICRKIAAFDGPIVDFYCIAPGHGNIGAIVAELGKRGQLPLKHKWRVSMYSGSFNMASMEKADIQALEEIMKSSDLPLVDMSSFPFFGGRERLETTDSLATFSLPDFTSRLLELDPLYTAAWKSFNDEFNVHLISPASTKLFKGSTLDAAESRRFDALKQVFEDRGVKEYAVALMADAGLWSKVAAYKKNTVAAFAADACDSPLCDQLVFFYQWLSKEAPSMLAGTATGRWIVDEGTGFTRIDLKDSGGIRAIQPVLKDPQNKESIERLRKVADDYIFKHLLAVRQSKPSLNSLASIKSTCGDCSIL